MYRVIVDYNRFKKPEDIVVIWDDSRVTDTVVEFTRDEVLFLSDFIDIQGVVELEIGRGIDPVIDYMDDWGDRNYIVRGARDNSYYQIRNRLLTTGFEEHTFDTLIDSRTRFMYGSEVKAIVTDKGRLVFLKIPDSVKFKTFKLSTICSKLGHNFLNEVPWDFTLIIDDNITSVEGIDYSESSLCIDATTCHNKEILEFIYRTELYSISCMTFKLPKDEISSFFVEDFIKSYDNGELPIVPQTFLWEYHEYCRPSSCFEEFSFDVCLNFLPMLFLFYAKMNHLWVLKPMSMSLAEGRPVSVKANDGEWYVSPDYILRNCDLGYTLKPELREKYNSDKIKLHQLQFIYSDAYDLLVYTYLTEDKELVSAFSRMYLEALRKEGHRIHIFEQKYAIFC